MANLLNPRQCPHYSLLFPGESMLETTRGRYTLLAAVYPQHLSRISPMPSFVRRTRIEAPAQDVFEWHKRPGAFERLQPPWEKVEVVERSGGIRDGDRVAIRSRLGPMWMRWTIEHRDYVEGEQFRDVQISGPFRKWEHTHRIISDGPNACTLEDDIIYEPPLGALGNMFGTRVVESKLDRMFQYRHAVTRADVLAHQSYQECGRIRVLVSGSTGLVGENLVALLRTGGHEAIRLSRHTASSEASWNTDTGRIEIKSSEPIDAVVHLAGENIAGRWSTVRKQRIRQSRVGGTKQIVDWMNGLDTPPRVFICASAIGYYGDRGDETLNEESGSGTGFLAEVCTAWEKVAAHARNENTRVVPLRFGVVLSPLGGALAQMLTPFKLGGGGIIGGGRQYWSWVSLDDAAGAILHALHCKELNAPVNAVSPHPVTNREFTKTLGRALHRPTIAAMPKFAARLAFGEMADELLLASQRVTPQRLTQTNYTFRHMRLNDALRHLLGLTTRRDS
jgi:uncharacterized protein (TIGR01777 family)